VILALTGQRIVSVEGVDEVDWSRPYFVTSNHQSYLDIPVLFRVLPTNLRFVAKQELQKLPFVAQYVDAMDMVWVDRASSAAAQDSIRAVGQAVAEGRTVLLFPEGTRGSDAQVARFKTGILSAAIGSGVDVLPVAIAGTERSMPRGFSLRPGTVRVRVGQPIPTDGLGSGDRRALADTAREAVAELHRELRRNDATP
jgi:1-acyl-sn-glycerol-3-phosphate acyltransferase